MAQQEGDQKRQQRKRRNGQEQRFIAPPEPSDKAAEGNAPSQKLNVHGAGQAREPVVHKRDDQQQCVGGEGKHRKHEGGALKPFVPGENTRHDGRRPEGVQVKFLFRKELKW